MSFCTGCLFIRLGEYRLVSSPSKGRVCNLRCAGVLDDLSQGRARKASWSMAVLGHRQKFFNLFYFHLLSIDFALRLISFNTEGFDFLFIFIFILNCFENEMK